MAEETTTPEEFTGEARVGGSDAFKLAIANLIGGRASTTDLTNQWISLHSADPGTTGTAGEITTGTGTSGRQKVTWGAAQSDGGNPSMGKITGNELTFDVAGSPNPISHYGVWTAQQGGVYLYGKPLSTQVALSSAGKVKITPTHSYGLKA